MINATKVDASPIFSTSYANERIDASPPVAASSREGASQPGNVTQASASAVPLSDPLSRFVAFFGLHAATATRQGTAAPQTSPPTAPTYPRPSETTMRACRDGSSETVPTTEVQAGERSLEQVADRLGIDADELKRANPKLGDATVLTPGQKIELPPEAKLLARDDIALSRCTEAGTADAISPPRARRTLADEMASVVKIAHMDGDLGHFDAMRPGLGSAIADEFVRIGELIQGNCSLTADRMELFDIGAKAVARSLNLEKEFGEAAARGDAIHSERGGGKPLRIWGDGSQATREEHAAQVERMAVQRSLQTLQNIAGGLGGALGYGLGGDRGSDFGAMVDTAVGMAGGTLQARAQARTTPPEGPPRPPAPGGGSGGGNGSESGFRAGVSRIGGPDRIAGQADAAPEAPAGRQRGDRMKASTSSGDVQEQAESIQRKKARSDTYRPTGDEGNDKAPPLIGSTKKSEDNLRNRTRDIRSSEDVDPEDWD